MLASDAEINGLKAKTAAGFSPYSETKAYTIRINSYWSHKKSTNNVTPKHFALKKVLTGILCTTMVVTLSAFETICCAVFTVHHKIETLWWLRWAAAAQLQIQLCQTLLKVYNVFSPRYKGIFRPSSLM